jgi:hypothetical protein
MRQAAPALNSAQLKQGLLDAAERKPNLAGLSVTGGRLNAAAAIQGVRSVAGLPPLAAYDPVPADPAPPAPSTPAPSPAPAPAPAPAPTKPTPSPSPSKPRTSPSRPAPRLHRLVAAPATAILCPSGAAGCRPRPARLSFSATSAATVTAQVQRRACGGSGCTYRTAATVKVAASAGTTRLAIGTGRTAHLAPGAYRVRLVAAAGGATSAPVAHGVTVKRR